MCMCTTPSACLVPAAVARGTRFPGNEVAGRCELPCEYWESTLDSLGEQPVLSATKLSLQPPWPASVNVGFGELNAGLHDYRASTFPAELPAHPHIYVLIHDKLDKYTHQAKWCSQGGKKSSVHGASEFKLSSLAQEPGPQTFHLAGLSCFYCPITH